MIPKDMDWLMEIIAKGIRNAPSVNSNIQARTVLDALEAAGVIPVPVEATEEMIEAAWNSDRENIGEEGNTLMPEPVWEVMLAASPLRKDAP